MQTLVLPAHQRINKVGRPFILACLLACALVPLLGHAPHALQRLSASLGDPGSLPLAFVPNVGQHDAATRLEARALGGTLRFMDNAVELALPRATQQPAHRQTITMRFVGASSAPELAGVERQAGIVNYLVGDDPAGWHTDIPTYAELRYRGLYPGVDLHYAGTQAALKGTYLVGPGADPGLIRWRYDGVEQIALDASGALRIRLWRSAGGAHTTLVEQAPVAWQTRGGQHVPVAVRFDVAADGSVGFVLGAYDPAYPLVLDPTLAYSSYLGGPNDARYQTPGDTVGNSIAVDGAGNMYLTGWTISSNFPTLGPVQPQRNGNTADAFVTKLNAAGNALVYSTYLGGNTVDYGYAIAVDAAGNAHITGYTLSDDFPTAAALIDGYRGFGDGFVAKLNAAGNALLYSTYLGGNRRDEANGIALDSAGNAMVAGSTESDNFPLAAALQPRRAGVTDAFVAKLNTAGSALVYSTYLGGSRSDEAGGIAVDEGGNAYLTGATYSTDFPLSGALQPAFGGGSCSAGGAPCPDAFVTKLNAAGSALAYSTYLGGDDNDSGSGLAVDASGSAYIIGTTRSLNFPLANPIQANPGRGDCVTEPCSDMFAAKLSPAGNTLAYSSYLGGSEHDYGSGIAVDASGGAYLIGTTESPDFPVADPIQTAPDPRFPGANVIVANLAPSGRAFGYSTYLGGGDGDNGSAIAVDAAGTAYITGTTYSTDFPTRNPFQASKPAAPVTDTDAFVAKITGGGAPGGGKQRIALPFVQR